MTIDEAIKFCYEKSKNIKLKAEPQVFIQIAEWLEELKAIKNWKADIMEDFCRYDASSFDEIVKNTRNKAIDDFAEKVKEIYPFTILELEELDDIAEQLKEGGSNG